MTMPRGPIRPCSRGRQSQALMDDSLLQCVRVATCSRSLTLVHIPLLIVSLVCPCLLERRLESLPLYFVRPFTRSVLFSNAAVGGGYLSYSNHRSLLGHAVPLYPQSGPLQHGLKGHEMSLRHRDAPHTRRHTRKPRHVDVSCFYPHGISLGIAEPGWLL